MAADPSALQTLQAIFPAHSTTELNRILVASGNQLDRATSALLGDTPIVSATATTTNSLKRPREHKLDGWLKGTTLEADLKPATRRVKPSNSTTAPSAFTLLRSLPSSSTLPSPNPPPPVNLPPLALGTPAMIAEHTHGLITLIPNVLPTDLAARLYKTMVAESEGKTGTKEAWDRNRWYLFEREVESPHTTSFYVEAPEQIEGKAYDAQAFAEAAHHWYNGEKRSARVFLPEMDEARELIASLVRTVLSERERHPLEWQGDWVPNVAAANCYRGAKESVGWHSDVLTYLGPYPTIASLSLGVSRPFRLRPFLPTTNSSLSATTNRTLEIKLDHNTLCIMHAGCQERFKHSIPPVGAMDVFRLPGEGREGRAYRERINMTFRHYRPDFAPLPTLGSITGSSTLAPSLAPQSPSSSSSSTSTTYTGTPHCHCGAPTLLRPDAKGRAKARLAPCTSSSTSSNSAAPREEKEVDKLLFFWTCAAGMQNEGKTCKFWQRLDMRKEGRGKWFVPPGSAGVSGSALGRGEGW